MENEDKQIKQKFGIELKLLSILLFFGLLYIFVTPPFQMADEDSHFKRAFLVSQFDLIPQANEKNELGFYLPKAVLDFEADNRYMMGDASQKFNYQKYYSTITASTDYSEKVFSQFSTVETNPLLYIPQALSMLLFRIFIYIFSLGKSELINPMSYMYAGRIGNLLFFILCSYKAIKWIPFYKRVLFLILCMPMTLGLVSSLSYDSMVISVCLLFISLILKLSFDKKYEKINRKHIIMLCILSFVLIELKQVYFPIIFLFFLIPTSKFYSTKKKYLHFSFIALAGIVNYLLWAIISTIHGHFGPDQSDATNQLIFILNNPIEYMLIIARTFYHLSFFYTNSFIGNLGWLDANFPPTFIYLYCLLILLTAIIDSNKNISLTILRKLFIFVIFAVVVVLIETGLYLTWTSIPAIGGIGYAQVSGVQGRYFIPIILLALTLLYNNKLSKYLKFEHNEIINTMLIAFCSFSCMLMFFLLIIRYWIPAV